MITLKLTNSMEQPHQIFTLIVHQEIKKKLRVDYQKYQFYQNLTINAELAYSTKNRIPLKLILSKLLTMTKTDVKLKLLPTHCAVQNPDISQESAIN